jgi:hypothetical protein
MCNREILNGDDVTEEPIRKDAAAMLRQLLDVVERGELDAPGSQGARLLRRIEGAVAGLEAASPQEGEEGSGPVGDDDRLAE